MKEQEGGERRRVVMKEGTMGESGDGDEDEQGRTRVKRELKVERHRGRGRDIERIKKTG